jgi:hypothetical protein
MRYKDLPKIMPPTYHDGKKQIKEEELDLFNPDLIKRLENQKLKQSQPYYNLLKENEYKMNQVEIEELKGSLKQIDDKFDRLIQKVEECKELNDKIHLKVKEIIWGIESEQRIKENE